MTVRASKRLKLPDIFPLPSQCSQYDPRTPQKARWDLDSTTVRPSVPFDPCACTRVDLVAQQPDEALRR